MNERDTLKDGEPLVKEAVRLIPLERFAALLAKKLKVKREDLKDFFDSPESYKKASSCYENIKVEDKPVFESVLEYVVGYQEDEDSLIGEEAAALFEKHGKVFAKSIKPLVVDDEDGALERDLKSGDRKRTIGAIVNIAENCGMVSKHSIATLSSQNVQIGTLMEVLSEEIFRYIDTRTRIWMKDDPSKILEAVLNNKKTPRQALVKVIQALMDKQWQIEMMRRFGSELNASQADIDALIERITKKVDRAECYPERTVAEKSATKVLAIKRIEDSLSR